MHKREPARMHLKILFLVPYPVGEAPSQRFRFEQYFEILRNSGHEYEIHSFLSSQNWQIFFKKGRTGKKLLALLGGIWKRVNTLGKSRKFDFVFIHREVTPVGPPVFEWILTKVLRKKIIYDFDDAIWLTDREQESLLMRILKYRWKVRMICKWAWKISCGNSYLRDYAKRYNHNTTLMPTTIDTDKLHDRSRVAESEKKNNGVTIGWTGSHSTLKYLEKVDDVLSRIVAETPGTKVLIIADKRPDLKTSFDFRNWNMSSEIADLMHIDIGIMPLPDDEWSRGKCGFKALQYFAMEKPAIASPVGVNKELIDNGINGFLCTTSDDWYKALNRLISDVSLRDTFGKKGRRKVVDHYSVKANERTFLSLFANS